MTDMELLDWCTTVHAKSAAELSRMYPPRDHGGKVYGGISSATVSNWRRFGAMPEGWRMYFWAQYQKTLEVTK
jgi:hypothetical protein